MSSSMGDEASRRMLLQKLKSRGVDSGESGEGFSGGAEIEEYIMNPKSGRLVLKTGKLGRKILVEQGGERKKRARPRKPESEKKPKGKRGRPKKSTDKVEELMTQQMITSIDDKTPEKKNKKKKVRFEPSGKNKKNKKLIKEIMTPEMIEYLDNYSEVDIPRPDNMTVNRDDLDSLLAKMGNEGTTKPADSDTSTKKGVRVPKKGRYVITEKKGDTITFQLKQ